MIYNTRSSNQKKHGMWPSESVSAITPFFVSPIHVDVETSHKREQKSWRTALWDAAEAPWGWLRSEAPPKTPAGPRQFGWKKRPQSRGHGDQPLDLSNEPPSRNHRIVRKNPWVQCFRDLGPKKTRTHLKKHIWWSCLRLGLFSRFDSVFCLSNLPMTYDGLVPRCPKVPCESHAVDPSCWVLSKHRFGCPAHVHRLTLRVSHPHKLPATFFEQKNTLDNTHTHNHTRTHIIFESLEKN